MKTIKYIISFFIIALALTSCKEEALMFNEDAAIYFYKSGILNPDSVIYSFGIRPAEVTTDTVYLTMRIIGNSVPRDREIILDLMPSSNAKPGYHYKMGPLIMPANQFQVRIPVYLFRRPGLKDSIIQASFKVAASKDFNLGYSDINSGQVKTKLEYKILMNDQILKPSNWEGTLRPYFGEFSVVKYRFMIETTGKTVWTGVIGPGDMAFLVSEVKLALYNYEQANGPMRDENGVTITLP